MIAPYLDASAIIYLLEGAPSVRAAVAALVANAAADARGRLIVSRLAQMECPVKPVRLYDATALATIDAFFTQRRVVVLEVGASVIERATQLRARYAFKTADAIHLASDIEARADAFVTGDAELAKCPGVDVHVVQS